MADTRVVPDFDVRRSTFDVRCSLPCPAMQVTSLLSRDDHDHDHGHGHHHHEHGPGCGCGHAHEHSGVGLGWMLFGLVLVLNAFVVDWILDHSSTVASISACIGAILLGTPIVITAARD